MNQLGGIEPLRKDCTFAPRNPLIAWWENPLPKRMFTKIGLECSGSASVFTRGIGTYSAFTLAPCSFCNFTDLGFKGCKKAPGFSRGECQLIPPAQPRGNLYAKPPPYYYVTLHSGQKPTVPGDLLAWGEDVKCVPKMR